MKPSPNVLKVENC